eukprot:gene8883-biopygen2458
MTQHCFSLTGLLLYRVTANSVGATWCDRGGSNGGRAMRSFAVYYYNLDQRESCGAHATFVCHTKPLCTARNPCGANKTFVQKSRLRKCLVARRVAFFKNLQATP